MTAPTQQMTPQQAFQTLTNELAASASDPLLDNDGTKFTLRQAIKRILWKVNYLLPLANRPKSPTQTDDLYGHVLSLRAEQLITQTVLFNLASKLGVDVATLRAQVIASLNVSASS